MLELSTSGGEDDGATNRGSKQKPMSRFWWRSGYFGFGKLCLWSV